MLPGFTDVVATTHAVGSWHTGALASHANEFAAMPSLHVAWAAWCTLAIWRATTRVWLRALAVVYPLLTVFAVLATGNHFLLDVFGGLLAIAVSVLIVELAGRRRRGQIGLSWSRLTAGRGLQSRVSRGSPYRMSQTCYEVEDPLD